MSEQHQINSWIASYMCDVVESHTRLDEIITKMRWRMLRGEPFEMLKMMFSARKHARELRTRLDALDNILHSTVTKVDDELDYTYTSEEVKQAGLKVVQQEKING